MCLAIVTTGETELTALTESISNAWESNPHGAGMAYAEDGDVVIKYGYFALDQFLEELTAVFDKSKNFLIHLRYASAGGIETENCHPFECGEYALIHNGTVNKFVSKDQEKSDSRLMSEYLSALPSGWASIDGYIHLVEDMIGNSKVALIDAEGKTYILNEDLWKEDGGTFYSNDYYKKEVKRVEKTVTQGGTVCNSCGCPLIGAVERAIGTCELCYKYVGGNYECF